MLSLSWIMGWKDVELVAEGKIEVYSLEEDY